MASSATATPHQAARRSNKSIYMVLGCTVFAAAAQVLMKFGATHADAATESGRHLDLDAIPRCAGRQLSAFAAGYGAHVGCNALLLILALRDGELSMLYPIIALTYVWVNLLSMYFFHDQMNVWKAAGIALVIGGVALLGGPARADEQNSPQFDPAGAVWRP